MTSRVARRRSVRILALAGAAVLVWLGAGLRRIPADRFAVREWRVPKGRVARLDGSWALAPPGLSSLALYPRAAIELPLPQADEAMLPDAAGSRFGFRGWVQLSVRADEWRRLHLSAHGAGVGGALLDAVREAAAPVRPVERRTALDPATRAAFEDGLARELAERGLQIVRLELDAFDFLAASPGRATGAPATRLLVVGLDGADWAIIDERIAAGEMPNLAALISRGVRAKLRSIQPMLSPVVWTSVATGVEPSRHGILDFLVADEGGGSRQPVTSAQRRVPAFWELLSRAGIDVGIVGWWASWPADAVRGYLVSDRLAYQLFGFRADPDDAAGKTWPPGLYDEVRGSIVRPESVGWNQVQPYLAGERLREDQFDAEERGLLEEFRTLLAAGQTHLAIAQTLGQRFHPRLEAVYFEGTDTVAHLFMPYRPPPLPGVDARRARSFGRIVDRYYDTADHFLGELLAGRDETWTVLVLSDHGFATDATRPRTTDARIGHGAAADWHRRFGILVLAGAHVRAGAHIDEAGIYDIAPTILALFGQPVPRSWPGRVLGQALSVEFLDRNPVRYQIEDPLRDELHAGDLVDPAAAALIEKLQSLGYVGTSSRAAEAWTARNNAGVGLLAEGRFAEAEQEFRQALAEGSDVPILSVNLGVALRLQGRVADAEPLFERALASPNVFRLAGNQLAQLWLDGGRLADAEELARRVLAREPDAADVHNTLGAILEQRADLDAARAEYERAAELDPDSAPARNNLGSLARGGGDLAQAERWYLQAIEADPYFMGAYNNLALVYQARGEMERAIDLYRRALAKAPDHALVLNNLASLYFARGELDEARTLWLRLADADPGYAAPRNNLAGVAIQRGELAEAERWIARALALDGNYGDARINLALVRAARGDIAGARAELVRASADPRSAARALARLGFLELSSGRVQEAVQALERAVALAPRDAAVLNGLGDAYLRQGQPAKAAEVWRRSLAVDPGQAELQRRLGSR